MRYSVVMQRKDGTKLEITRPGENMKAHCEWLAAAMNACRSIPTLGHDRSGAYEYVVEEHCEKENS